MKRFLWYLAFIYGLWSLTGCGASSSGTRPIPLLATHFSVTPATSSPIAGTAFNFKVNALDASNAIVSSYTGTVQFTSSDGRAVLPTSSKLTNGSGTFSATLNTAASETITATDTVSASITGTSSAIIVSPVAATHLSVMASATATSGTALNFTVTALDGSNNVVTSYSGTLRFASTDSQAALPANSTLTNGTANFSATLKTSGKQTITATDSVTPTITGTSSSINVSTPGSLAITSGSPPNGTVGAEYSGTMQRCRGGQCQDLGGFPLTASGGVSPYTWSGTSLPPGLRVSNDGFVRGEPTAAGTYNVIVTATDSASPAGHVSANYSINIDSAAALTITSGSPPGGRVGDAYDVHCDQVPPCNETIVGFPLNATGGAYPYSWSWAGSTPPGLNIGSLQCVHLQVGICGTPTAAGTYNVTVTLTDSEVPAVRITANYTINITDGAAAMSSAGLLNPDHHRQHHHYKLINIGTLGGPNSSVGFAGYVAETLNPHGTAIGQSDTSIPDHSCAGCLLSHPFQWGNGTLIDLDALPGLNNSYAFWINSHDWAAGLSENSLMDPLTGSPETAAVLWKDGEIIDLGTLGGSSSAANAVNNRGQVVGGALNAIPNPFSATFFNTFINETFGFYFFPVATESHAFLWQDGVMKDLGTLGGPDSVAWFVNEHGQIAGQSSINSIPSPTTGVPTVDPFFWDDGKMVDVGNLGGTFSFVSGFNNRGQMTGTMSLPGDLTNHPFLWDRGILVDLGTLGGDNGVPNAINDASEIVGFAGNQENQAIAFLWKNGAMINLGTVDGDPCSAAHDINSMNQVVGESSPSCFDPTVPLVHAFLWENGGPMVDLNTLVPPGSQLESAAGVSINDRGEIVGDRVLPNGDTHAFVLIPCDENHPDLDGCDYNTVDADADTAAEPNPAQVTRQPTANPYKISPADVMTRFRSLRAGRNRRFGTPQTSPK